MNPNRKTTVRTVFLLLMVLAVSVRTAAAERLTYLDTTGDKKIVYSWAVEYDKETATITVDKDEITFVNHCLENGDTVGWSMQGSNSEVQATLDDGILRVSGTFEGERLDRRMELKGLPWFQPLSYSLPRTVKGQGKRLMFWTIRPDTLEPVKLRAEFKGRETLAVDGESVHAFKIRVSPPGILSMFWHGDYWYREEDGRFLRYEGMSGPPGAPMTLVLLLEEAQGEEEEKG